MGFRDALEQEDVSLPLVISLGMAMLNIFFHRPPQGAFAKILVSSKPPL
jgi:hypothetical protein